MVVLNRVAEAMQTVFTTKAEKAAQQSGFCRRKSPLGGPVFVQATTFACLAEPLPTLDDFCQAAAAAGVVVQPQSFDDRFGPKAAEFLRLSLADAVAQVVAETPLASGLLARFTAVAIQDGSTVVLPDCLEDLWQGNGGKTDHNTRSAVKLQVRLDLRSGRLTGPLLYDGRCSDQKCALQGDDDLPAGAVRIADLGYFDLDEFQRLDRKGVFFVSRYQCKTALYALGEQGRIDLAEWLAAQTASVIDVPVKIGKKHLLAGRLVAIRVPQEVAHKRRQRLLDDARDRGKKVSAERLRLCGWTLLLTNLPAGMASVEELAALARCRWQIELLFKLWKSGGGLGKSRSDKPYRVLCEVYAKMIAVVVQHWALVAGCWRDSRRSLTKAAKAVRRQAMSLVNALADRAKLLDALRLVVAIMAAGSRTHRSKKDPRTWQLEEGHPHAYLPPRDPPAPPPHAPNAHCGVPLS
jgi:Transposase DDE domain